MNALQGMRKLGFRKWYERALLRSHGHLVLLIFCVLAILGAAEAFTNDIALGSQLVLIVCVLVAAVIGVWALRRYFYLLQHAEFVADQAVCSQCQAYARWDVQEENTATQQLRVRCRGCGHCWNISM